MSRAMLHSSNQYKFTSECMSLAKVLQAQSSNPTFRHKHDELVDFGVKLVMVVHHAKAVTQVWLGRCAEVGAESRDKSK